jgi:hypothetical protein
MAGRAQSPHASGHLVIKPEIPHRGEEAPGAS